MKKDKRYTLTVSVLALTTLGSCGIYHNYERPKDILPDGLYREDAALSAEGDSLSTAQMPAVADSSSSFGERSWKEVFTSPLLQSLISKGLENNTDLNIAQLRIAQAEASFRASRLAMLPSLAFSPQGTVSSFDGAKASQTYSLPFTASWQVDLFGHLRNAKKQSRMLLESSKAYRQAVQTQVIATIARTYFQLSMLHEQQQLSQRTADIWKENVRAMKAFMQEGQYTEAAVSQAEASYNQVEASVLEIRQQIVECESTLSALIGETSHAIESEPLAEWKSPNDFSTGIPLLLLSSRPDVRQAELNLAAAFYATSTVRGAFYPSVTLNGTAGWTNSAGVITNPGKFLLEAIGTLTQPIFQNGRLQADLRIAKAQQEEARLNFRQSLINAGAEVNNALAQIQTSQGKANYLQTQTAALERAVETTHLLMENGSANYLEVLTAQESLLSAQFSLLQNHYDEINAFIALYQALGGGRE